MNYKIVVIDDEKRLLENIGAILTKKGFQVALAENGRVGLEVIEKENPDLILCDVKMPELTGFEVLKVIRTQMNLDTPFIFLTSKAEREDIRAGMELGADDYITKPFTMQELIASVELRLEKYKKIEYLKNFFIKSEKAMRFLGSSGINSKLHAIINLANLFEQDLTSYNEDELNDMVSHIKWNANQLLSITQKLSLMEYLNRTDQNFYQDMISEQNTVDPAPILNDLVPKMAEPYGRESDFSLELYSGNTTLEVFYVERIFKEMLDNSFKFSEKGSVVKIFGSPGPNGYLIRITTRGKNFNQDQIRKIDAFEKFTQLSDYEGPGLGLYIVQKILEKIGCYFEIHAISDSTTQIEFNLP